MVSSETREVLVDAVESREIASYVVAARQQMRDENPFLFITLEDAHGVLYEQPTTFSAKQNIRKKLKKLWPGLSLLEHI
jgi:hypothetical protein